MRLTKVTFAAVCILATVFTGCKPKDSDIQSAIRAKEATNVSVLVNDGVATLTGDVADSSMRSKAEEIAQAEKGVKSVVNNITVTAPVAVVPVIPTSVNTVLDAATQQTVKDGMKDFKAVTVTFSTDKAVLSGEVSKADRMKIMQILAAAKVKSDVTNLTDKK